MEQIAHFKTACLHCGLQFFAVSKQRFCCAGCEFVFGLIGDQGLGEFYSLRETNPPACPVPVRFPSTSYDFCDDPELIQRLSPDGIRLRFYLEGINCTACLWLIEKLPSFCADAESARINLSTSTVEVARKQGGSFANIASTLNRFGYRPHPLSETESALDLFRIERRRDLIRIGVAGAATGNIMIMAVSLYAGATVEFAAQFRWLSAVLALPVLTYCALPFYKSFFAAIRSRRFNLDVPIVLAIFAGVTVSTWSLLNSSAALYFDSLSMLIFLLLSSRFFLKSIQTNHIRTTNLEDELFMGTVERISENGSSEKVSALSLMVDDVIRVSLDHTVPADGVVRDGYGAISVAILTGESDQVQIGPGSRVEAGSKNLIEGWTLKVERPPAQTRLANILRDTEESARLKSNFIKSSDRIAGWFIFIVFSTALAVIAYHLASNPLEGITRALALIIVTCPCVFGMAIPLSMSLAIRAAARQGTIIKSADAIEQLWKTTSIVFDKTGTLTTGEMSVLHFSCSDFSLLGFLMSLQFNQKHPVAKTIYKFLHERGIECRPLSSVSEILAGGMSGHFGESNYSVRPTNKSFEVAGTLVRSSYTFYCDEEVIAVFDLGDEIRIDASELVAWARQKYFKLQLVSGDRSEAVETCAKVLGFKLNEVSSQISPEEKAKIIGQLGGNVVMIGDGANDTPALAAASVGIAVHGSLDTSLRAADIYLTRQTLQSIPQVFLVAKLTKRAISRNLIFSATFNLISGALAVMGFMTPLWAAVLMPVSSLVVLLSALYSGRKISQLKDVL